MKFAEEIYPKGTFKDQQTDGAYIDGTLSKNLDVLAKKINNDMHFTGIVSGHDQVRDGKTTIATHVGTYLTWKINKLHGVHNTFTDKNLVMNGKDLDKISFELPPLSVIVLDEGDDLTTHGMKDLAVKLKRYFRKCGQLNQILILILPSFFELPKFFALNRSHFLIDVYFRGEYERGYFEFYSPRSKKLLYLKGKREWDYNVQKSDFKGRFFGSYCFFPELERCVDRYKYKKKRDLMDDGDPDNNMKPEQIRREQTIRLFQRVHQNLIGISVEKLALSFGFTKRTGFHYLKYDFRSDNGGCSGEGVEGNEKDIILSKDEIVDDKATDVVTKDDNVVGNVVTNPPDVVTNSEGAI